MSVTPDTYNISIYRGASFKKLFEVTDNESPTPGAIDITGCELRAQIRQKPNAAIMLDLNTPDEITITDAANGKFRIFISRQAIVDAFPFPKNAQEKEYEWDLFIEWPNGEDVDCWWQGSVLLDPNVTDPSVN